VNVPLTEPSPEIDDRVPFMAWVILICTCGVYTLTFVDRLAWGSVSAVAGASLGMGVGSLGLFVTSFYTAYVCSNVFGGFLTDWAGPRKVLLSGLLPLGVLTFVFGYTSSVSAGLLIQIGMGLAAGIDYTACIKLITVWFPSRTRSTAMGFFMVGSSLGVVLTNAIMPYLLKSIGWRGAFKCIGALTILWGLIAFILIRDRASRGDSLRKKSFAPLLRNRNLLLLAFAGFGVFWAIIGFTNWANALMVKGHHFPLVSAGAVVALFGVGAMLGKPLMGLIADRMPNHQRALLMFCMASFCVMLLLFGHLQTQTAFLYCAPFAGLTCQWSVPLMATLVSEEATTGLTGSATGVSNAVWQLAGAVVPLVVGSVFQKTHSFSAAFYVLAAGPVFGMFMIFFLKKERPMVPDND
jgi:sugar phosphate permease